MKKHGNDKYRPRFSRQLLDGMRNNGESAIHCARQWGVTLAAIRGWLIRYPEFAHAWEMAEYDCAIYWHNLNNQAASGNLPSAKTALIELAMANTKHVEWRKTPEAEERTDTVIHRIILETAPTALPNSPKIIEHDNG